MWTRHAMRRALLPCLICALSGVGLAQQVAKPAPAPAPPPAPATGAVALADQAVQVVESLSASLWKGRILLAAAVVQGKSGNRNAANRLFQQAKAVVAKAEPSGDLLEFLSEQTAIDGFFQEVGIAQYESGDFEAAVTTLAGNAQGLRQLAHALIGEGNLQQAAAVISDRIPADDVFYRPWAMTELAVARAKRGDIDEALRLVRQQSRLARRAGALGEVAVALAASGRVDQARAVAEEAGHALEQSGDDGLRAVNSYNVAAAYAAVGDEAAAISVAKRENEKNAAPAFREVARAQGKAGRLQAAIRSAESVSPAERGALLAELAVMAAGHGDAQAAATLCRSAVTNAIEQVIKGSRDWHDTILGSLNDIGADCARAGQDGMVSSLIVFTGTADFDGNRGSVIAAIGSALLERGDTTRAKAMLDLLANDEKSWLMRPLVRAYARDGRTADVNRLLAGCADAPSRAEAYIGAAEGTLARTMKR